MKKLFTLLMLACITLSVNAQSRKLWDFTQGWEDSRANLDADATNWTKDATDATTQKTTRWKDATKIYGTLKANGEPITELEGLVMSSSGLSKNGNYLLSGNAFRVTRNGQTINLPKLKKGQKVTVVARSANGTATNRGFVSANDNMTYISGPENGICLGNQVEGSLGTYTLVWEVTAESDDSVDIAIKTYPNGGLDISSIMIDDGKVGPGDSLKIGYLYNATPTQALKERVEAMEGYQTTAIDLATADLATLSLQDYDVVVIDPAIGTDKAEFLKTAIPWQPVVNFCADLYDVWGYGTVATPSSELAVIKKDHSLLFADLEITEEEKVKMFSVTNGEAMPVGVSLAGNFADDDVYAVDFKEAGDETPSATLFHSHNNNHNAYYYMPYSATAVADVPAGTEPIFANVIKAAAKSKAKVGATPAPLISVTHAKLSATVTITDKVAKAAIYYTTDGTEPTKESTLYDQPFTLTTACILKAIAIGEGYTESKVALDTIVMYDQTLPATITYNREAGQTTVTLTANDPADEIYYNYTGSKEIAQSSLYTQPLLLTRPATVTTFSTNPEKLQSEIASQAFGVDGITAENIYLDIDSTSFMTASKDYWWWETSGGSSKVAYYHGKTPTSCYLDEEEFVDFTSYYPKNAGVPSDVEPWVFRTRGQCVLWEGTTIESSVYHGTDGYYADAAEDLMGIKPSSYFVEFGAAMEGEPYTAVFESTKKFKGPFEVESFIGNCNSEGSSFHLVVETSADGQKWEEIDSLKTSSLRRLWKRNLSTYNGTDSVYVRFSHKGGNSKLAILNIDVRYNGPLSKQYVDPQGGGKILLGDANNDGVVDVADITAMASYILGTTPAQWNATNADANQDKVIDVADITATAGIILSK